MENLKQNLNLSIITNQINFPTFIVNLTQILLKLIEKDAFGFT